MTQAPNTNFAELPSEAALLVDGRGVVLSANKAAAAMLGRSSEDLVDRPLASLTSDGEAAVSDLIRIGSRSPQTSLGALSFRDAASGPDIRTRCEFAAVRPRSEGGPALISVRLFRRHGVVDRFLLLNQRVEALSKEIVRRRAAEAKLEAYSEQLVDAGRRKDEFLAMLAHELRNPLAPMALGVELLESMHSSDPKLERVSKMLRRQLGHLARLVDDLLDIARLTHGKIELSRRPMAIDDVLHQAIEMFRSNAEERGLTLQVEPIPDAVIVDADPVRLVQVFGNLLSNAIKFSRPGGRIEVSARVADGGISVSVRDDGVGIEAGLLPQVFDLFVQADRSLDRQHSGLGVGLSVVRNIVELHGGTVSAASGGIDQGTEMTVWLPVTEAGAGLPAAGSDARRVETAAAAGLRVLVVEDNTDAAEAMRDLLVEWGHEAACVGDGPAALAMWPEWQPDVALMDIGLPGLSGHELARRCRQLAGGRPLLLLALSGYGSELDMQNSRDAGFDDHLVKPVDLDHLEKKLANHAASLGKRRAG